MKRTPLSPMSKKRRSQLAERKQVCADVLERDNHTCQFMYYVLDAVFSGTPVDFEYPTDCLGPLDVHEIIPRSAWSAGWLERSNCVTVCRHAHHAWVTDHPSEAYRLGLHGYSWNRTQR